VGLHRVAKPGQVGILDVATIPANMAGDLGSSGQLGHHGGGDGVGVG
jgi:hypothetical protein